MTDRAKLTREQVEERREVIKSLLDASPDAPEETRAGLQFTMTLCDMALASLDEQKAVPQAAAVTPDIFGQPEKLIPAGTATDTGLPEEPWLFRLWRDGSSEMHQTERDAMKYVDFLLRKIDDLKRGAVPGVASIETNSTEPDDVGQLRRAAARLREIQESAFLEGDTDANALLNCAATMLEVKTELVTLRAENERLREQLPEGMKHCTIQFKECHLGHGWLTATNWVQHGCQTCELSAERERREKAEAAILGLVNCANDVVEEWRDSVDDDSMIPTDHATLLLEDAIKNHATTIERAKERE